MPYFSSLAKSIEKMVIILLILSFCERKETNRQFIKYWLFSTKYDLTHYILIIFFIHPHLAYWVHLWQSNCNMESFSYVTCCWEPYCLVSDQLSKGFSQGKMHMEMDSCLARDSSSTSPWDRVGICNICAVCGHFSFSLYWWFFGKF